MAFKRNGGDEGVSEPDPATWSPLEERLFVYCMVNEVDNGNRSATTFTRKGWKQIEQVFFKKTGRRYSLSQFRNKFNQLRTRYFEFSRLLKEPGFFWNPIQNTVTGADNIWESYIKANRTAKRFRKKGCPMFTELETIFGEEPASRYKNAAPLAQYPPMYGEDDKLEHQEGTSTNATPSIFPNSADEDGVKKGYQRRRSRTPTSQIGEEKDDTSLGFMNSERGYERWELQKAFTITKCVKCLESIEGVDESTYLKAINMFKDVDWREMFMAMSSDRKLVWLASL